MNNGQRQDAALGYDFDRSYYNMNCNFGSSIHIQPEDCGGRCRQDGGYVYIGAPLHHHQGFNLNRRVTSSLSKPEKFKSKFIHFYDFSYFNHTIT